MRLNGKRQVCAYLGVNPKNRRAWRAVKVAYGAALWRLPGGRIWGDSAALNEIDRARSKPLKGEAPEGAPGGQRGARDFQRALRSIWGKNPAP